MCGLVEEVKKELFELIIVDNVDRGLNRDVGGDIDRSSNGNIGGDVGGDVGDVGDIGDASRSVGRSVGRDASRSVGGDASRSVGVTDSVNSGPVMHQ